MASTPHPLFTSSTASRAASQTLHASGPAWYLWAGVLALTSATIGGSWDVAWHRSIGRDSFWTPAHLLIQLCGLIAAGVGLTLVIRATRGSDAGLKNASVSILGLRAPLGVFLAAWGGVAMLTSAPFDNWWHNAYGLDVKIISPPHVLLILGVRAVSVGFLFLILAEMNRANTASAPEAIQLRRLFLYMGGLMVCGQMFFLQELTDEVRLHTTGAYIAMAVAVPVVLAAFAVTSQYPWAATTCAGIYLVWLIAEILIFPLFPATPKLGPVYYPVTHLIPAKFPILLIAPAFALDLLWQQTKHWKTWQIALVSGVIFTAVLVAVEWPFANFLMSKWSANRFFGTMYFDYGSRPESYDRLRMFWSPAHGVQLIRGLSIAVIAAALSTLAGLQFGKWARGVQR